MTVAIDWLFRDRRTGRVVLWQWPNLPLFVWLAAKAVLWLVDPHGAARAVTGVIADGALTVWAVLEIGLGTVPWRRILGAVVLAGLVVGWAR